MSWLGNAVDGLLYVVSPRMALANRQARAEYERFSYRNARSDRLRKTRTGLGGSGDKQASAADLWTLRELSRDLDRNNCIASGILDRAEEAIIGSGLPIHFDSGSKLWNEQAELIFWDWWMNEADIRGLMSGPQIERTAFRSVNTDGDILAIKTKGGRLQFIEAHRIITPRELTQDVSVINGVKVDHTGRPLRFFVAPETRSVSYRNLNLADMDVVEAGDAFFTVKPRRFSQTRGVPVFATNLALFEDIDAYLEASLVAAKTSAAFVMAITRKEGGKVGIDNSVAATDSAGNNYREEYIRPGRIEYLQDGEDVKGISHTQPGPQFAQFITQLLRFSGLNFGMPLEVLSLDFSRTNYSSARAAMLVAHRANMVQHQFFFNRFMAPIAKWRIDRAIRLGEIADRASGYHVTTTPPKMVSIDPLKDALGDVELVENGFSSHKEICAARGLDWIDNFKQRAEEITRAMKLAEKIGGSVTWRDIMGPSGSAPAVAAQEKPQQEEEDEQAA